MKKKVLGLSIAFASVGLGLALVGGIKGSTIMVRADDGEQTTEVEVVETETEQEKTSLSQTCKDAIEFMKNLFSQPLVIGGVSTTVGALAILIISKAIGGISKKKLIDLTKRLDDLVGEIGECVAKKDYDALKGKQETLLALCKEIVPTIKNINVRKECEQLLVELEPVKEEIKEFAINEKDKVVADVKVEHEKVGSEIIDILKQE